MHCHGDTHINYSTIILASDKKQLCNGCIAGYQYTCATLHAYMAVVV